MSTREEWQKIRPEGMTPEEWDVRKVITDRESAAIAGKKFWKLILTFLSLVLVLLMTPFAEKIAEWILSLFGSDS